MLRMTEQFELLEDNDQGLSETQKVKQFLKGILSTHPDVRSIINQVHSQFSTNFYEASKHFAGQLSLIPGYTATQQSTEVQHQRGSNAGARFGGHRYGGGPNR
jgi:hypothetical protein